MRADTLTAGNSHPNLAAAAGWWLYEHAPAPVDSLLRFGRRHLAPLLHRRPDLRSYHLADASSGQIVAAGDGMTLGFLLQRLGRMSAAAPCSTGLASLSAALRRADAEGDLVLAMVPRAIGRRIGRGFLRAPALVSLALEVKHDLEATLAQATTTVRRDARRVLEMGVTWTVSHALSELDRFYDHYLRTLSAPAVWRARRRAPTIDAAPPVPSRRCPDLVGARWQTDWRLGCPGPLRNVARAGRGSRSAASARRPRRPPVRRQDRIAGSGVATRGNQGRPRRHRPVPARRG